MPLKKIPLKAGFNKQDTSTAAEGQWIDGAKFYRHNEWIHNEKENGAYALDGFRVIIPVSKTFEAYGLIWTKHKPGDPMPCDGDSKVNILLRDELVSSYNPQECFAHYCRWDKEISVEAQIIGWRYADKKTVRLGPSDIPPCSVFRWKHREEYGFYQPSCVCKEGVCLSEEGYIHMTFEELMDQCEINRPKHRDAEGNPTLWEPCSKEEV